MLVLGLGAGLLWPRLFLLASWASYSQVSGTLFHNNLSLSYTHSLSLSIPCICFINMDEILLKDKWAHLRCPAYNSAFSRRPTRNTCCIREGPVHQSASVFLEEQNNILINKVHLTLLLTHQESTEGEKRGPNLADYARLTEPTEDSSLIVMK